MGAILTNTEFIYRSKSKYGDKFGYTKAIYRGLKEPIILECINHGFFKTTPYTHLKSNSAGGCQKCKIDKHRGKVYGKGINDIYNVSKRCYRVWTEMLKRCYDEKYHHRENSYIICEVCDEWLILSNFKRWFDENYVEGYELDKDILGKGSKIYSPSTCCFVPKQLNNLIKGEFKRKNDLPKGVEMRGSKYLARIRDNGKYIRLGLYEDVNLAHEAYLNAKRKIIYNTALQLLNDAKINDKIFKEIKYHCGIDCCEVADRNKIFDLNPDF